jgi:endonuclease/exonuclease/phosphatase family metal-dependent hydrolase
VKNKICLGLLLIPFLLWGDPGLNVLTFNIDTNARIEEGYGRDAFPELRVKERMPKIIKALQDIIDTSSPDVIQLQEGRKFHTKHGDLVDSITPLVSFLRDKGYHVGDAQYNPTGKSFSYIEGIKKDKFHIDKRESKYFTKTPDVATDHTDHDVRKQEIKDHNFGEEWERSTHITKFHDEAGQTYYAFNINLPVGLQSRLQASEQLKGLAKRIIEEEPNAKIIMTGDFNTFPDWGGPDQLKIMTTNSPLEEATKTLMLPNGKKVNTSFIAFPHDFGVASGRLRDAMKPVYDMEAVARKKRIVELFAQEAPALGGHLDRVYHYGFGSASSTLIPTPQFEGFDLDQFGEEYVKQYILDHVDEGPAFVSDHQPVLTRLK